MQVGFAETSVLIIGTTSTGSISFNIAAGVLQGSVFLFVINRLLCWKGHCLQIIESYIFPERKIDRMSQSPRSVAIQ